MGATLTIRLSDKAREILSNAARERGSGLSAYVRQVAEAEAKRLRNDEIRRGFKPVIEYLSTHPEAREELELLGTPQSDLPDEDWPEWGIVAGRLVE
ncbi:MAG: CopG family transcriptional regulator [Chloroflexota bacterium]